MYNLLVSHQVEERAQGTFEMPRSRFLEYTSASISVQLQSLSIEAIESIKSWPCVLMQEGRGEEVAHLAQITAIEVAGVDIKLVVESLPCDPPILNDALWRTRADLDIGQFEFSRNHWAIKDRDLFPVLRAAGHTIQEAVVDRFESGPLPAPSRSELISAGKVIAALGHSDIDDFLLEAGVDGLAAGRDLGSRRDRANAIVEFAVQHPTATTAENSLFSVFITRRASAADMESGLDTEAPRTSKPATEAHPERLSQNSANRSPNRVFIVHGQNNSARTEVASFLSSVGLEGIVLHEQPSMGRHLLTKFIEEAELVTFAIILMTDDDVGGLRDDDPRPRARQNVILELGYFLSHLGQQGVCALITPGLETPSDFDGIVYIRMDEGGQWKVELERELKAAAMPIARSPRTPEEMWPGKIICVRCNGPIEGTSSVSSRDGGPVHPFDCLDDG